MGAALNPKIFADQLWAKSPDGLIITDDTGTIVAANPVAEELFGYGQNALVGESVEILVPSDLRSGHARWRLGYQQAPAVRPLSSGMHLMARKADGTTLPVQISLSPLEDGAYTLAAIRDVAERRAIEAHVADLSLKRLLAEDRERIARDLHDTVVQELFVLGMRLQSAAGLPAAEIEDRLVSAVDAIDSTINGIRKVVFELRDVGIEYGFRADLMRLIAQRTASFQTDPQIHFRGSLDDVEPDIRNHLYSVLSEALANVVKHSGADELWVSVTMVDGTVQLVVRDNGTGGHSDRVSGTGNMQERARQLGGSFEIDASDDDGTTVRWTVPINQSAGETSDPTAVHDLRAAADRPAGWRSGGETGTVT